MYHRKILNTNNVLYFNYEFLHTFLHRYRYGTSAYTVLIGPAAIAVYALVPDLLFYITLISSIITLWQDTEVRVDSIYSKRYLL
jgi:hypothetical protein